MEGFVAQNFSPILLTIIAVCWSFNLIYTAIINARKENERIKEPFKRIDVTFDSMRARMDSHEREINYRVDNLERRMDLHENDLKDIHLGQSAMLLGVQALLNHELHNGNEDEMKSASDVISKWLINRK